MNKVQMHKQLCDKLHDTYERKNADYGDSFAKTRDIVPNAILVRLHDKLNRVTALMTGNKQQVISRIERKESIPTIRAFSRILDALGYELQIVKKKSL